MDTSHQVLVLLLMVMGPEDIAKVRFGRELSQGAIEILQILRDNFGVVFKIKCDSTNVISGQNARSTDGDGVCSGGDGAVALSSSSILVSCLGIGHKNISRKIR